ncbi:MAG: hypothetical protein MUE46_06810 [Xanthomonadales bacterium]|jgi:hypothetical protein|nr:hypothetical protein [Xanthomonadales bacterium]
MKRLALALCLSLALAGCGTQEDPAAAAAPKAATVAPKPSGPVEQIETQLAALRNNDLAALMKASIPKDKLAEMRADYEQTRAEPITEEDRKQFDESIGKLLAEGGVDQMMTELEPKLAEMKPQLPMIVGMGVMMAQQGVQQSTELSEAQKAQMGQMLTGLQTWAMQTDFADPARLRRALEAMKDGLAQSGIQRIEDLNARDFEQMLSQFGPVVGGVKGALSAYDLDVNAMLASIKPTLIAMEGDLARLKIDYTMFGTPLSLETELTRKDGYWYSKEALSQLERETAGEPAAESEPEDAATSE